MKIILFVKDGYIGKIEYPLDEESVSLAVKKFRYVYDKYINGTDAKVYFSVIPDKNYFLVEDDYLSIDYDKMLSQVKTEARIRHHNK